MEFDRSKVAWLTIWFTTAAIHIFPKKEISLWGYEQEFIDGPIHNFGLGPFLYICWSP